MPGRSARTHRTSGIQTFGVVLPNVMIESILDPDHPDQLRLHTWDGRKSTTAPKKRYGGCTYMPAPLVGGLAQAVRFPATSKQFGSAAELTSSMLKFVTRYAQLWPDAAALLVTFAVASRFPDCFSIAPSLYLLGPANEASLILRLLGCLCRRPILLGDIDSAALATLPSQLDATLLINQRKLAGHVTRILQASGNRHFCIARGTGRLHAYGAKAFSADPEVVHGVGVHVSFPPAQGLLPTLTDADEKDITNEFQAKLLRYRLVNLKRVRTEKFDTRDFVPAMRDEARAWLAPICDCPDLQKSVLSSLLQQSREFEGERVSDDRCAVAEGALFFCHRASTDQFFVGDLAQKVNDLLNGRHEDRVLSAKKVGLLLRALGIHGERVVQGYKVRLTESVRKQIH